MANVTAELTVGGELLRKAIGLVEDPASLYRSATDAIRRLMNQSFFETIYVDQVGDVTTDPAEPFASIRAANTTWVATGGTGRRTTPDIYRTTPPHREGVVLYHCPLLIRP